MLAKRYENDGKPIIKLNDLQLETKGVVDLKVSKGIYRLEKVPCCICGNESFQELARKDRYGLSVSVVICRDCGLIQTNPRMDQCAYDNFYNEEYRKLYVGTEVATENFFKNQYNKGKSIHNFFLKHDLIKKSPKDLFIFEVGCGAGGILQYFKEQGFKVKGIDLGKEYLEYGISNYGLELEAGKISEVELDVKPDIVIYSHVLEHILDLNSEIQYLSNMLNREGFVYIEVPGVKNLDKSYEMNFLRMLQNAHVYHFTLSSLNNLMLKNGYENIVGNEVINSVYRFEKYEGDSSIINDYEEVVNYLKKYESVRKLYPISPYKLKRQFKRIVMYVLKFLGIKR